MEDWYYMKEQTSVPRRYAEEAVHSPKHYQLANGVEVIDIIEAVVSTYDDPVAAARMTNVIKYVLRAGNKDDFKQDLSKARWYLDRQIESMED